MTGPLLDIQNYRLDIGTFDGPVHVLKDINLTVNRGDTLGIVGESGSGKTVLVRSVLGIGPKASKVVQGNIAFDGQDITALSERDWTKIRGIRISMIFQDPMTYLNPLFTIGQQISDVIAAHEKAAGHGVSSKATRRARTEDLLDQVGLPNPAMLFDQYPHQLSGGMRQRVLIAMALSGKPDLLIADEPTTALDVTVQAQVLDLINSLVEKLNLTVIMISHDIGAIATIAKRCAVMYKGEIVEQGLTADILSAPKHEYTKRLLAAVPDIDTAAAKVAAEPAVGKPAKPGVLLEAIDLKKVYRSQSGSEVTAVDGINLSVATGEIFGVVGESGSGKSTLARMLLRLIEPTSGDIIFDGRNISGLTGEPMRLMRRHMQFVFQNPHSALNGRHTIGDAIGEPLRIQTSMGRRDIEARVEALLDIVQLPKMFKYRYPHELSGGQKQRICIARAIALNPRLLILDEPTSALDISVQAQVLDFLQELRAELDLTYVFISHNLAVIRQICDRTIVMKRGVIVEQGETERLFLSPQHEYTRALIESGRKTSRAANLSAPAGS
ncbi:ABC transporter ATP-binding protein [Neorhizobium galegae]|uniref:ABC transporter ATP-binding protein n=1 Tax=Neorhizobium galegae TaxID=399 RepID=UPI000621E083|nr:ABC transporter ATP-binding protein [Neorhizobium galegae]CDZ46641.1 Dipeptide-transport ATP-binding protein ABC transporter DppD [Neorhizobium galegae bv. orientalis]